ncbi:HLF transcription factor, PAR bZIP family member a [Echeneis naucrates]|uniref:HLF transcription factor, PAR bZIP family member a n=1 Tax=Echeneis naucrates TaxID=173247 RepID=UPI001113CCF3|nr:hepatic leukemia factor-like [Echeneis naucrates]
MEKMARPLPINTTFLPPTHCVLKSLLENPLKLPFHHDEGFGKDKEKEKKLEDESSTASHPQSAFLGPTLWDKTLPYDGDNFQLEYMDLEEFLSENGIPANTTQSDQAPPPPQPAPPTPSVVDLSSRATTSVHSSMAPQTCLHSPSTAVPVQSSSPSLAGLGSDTEPGLGAKAQAVPCRDHMDSGVLSKETVRALRVRRGLLISPPHPKAAQPVNAANRRSAALTGCHGGLVNKNLGHDACVAAPPAGCFKNMAVELLLFFSVKLHVCTDSHPESDSSSNTQTSLPSARDTPSPIDPESIQVPVTYEPDPADLALSSVPGQEIFDPRKRKFSAEELKPQPMIKKARKVFIPDDLKDDKYWARRRKNNVAAKRSRDARRLKENQIAIRAGFLEKENAALRMEVADLRKELGRCKNILAKYEARHGPL